MMSKEGNTVKVAYVAGPYRASTVRGIVDNICSAEKVAIWLWKNGYAAVCPHKNTALLDGVCPDDVWLQGGIEIMKRCDLVVCAPYWYHSRGTLIELEVAYRNNIPVYELAEGQLVQLTYETSVQNTDLDQEGN